MKIDISTDGVLLIVPETSIEFYAIKQWQSNSKISVNDFKNAEEVHYRGSKISIFGEEFYKETK
jgi:hypothetical protein